MDPLTSLFGMGVLGLAAFIGAARFGWLRSAKPAYPPGRAERLAKQLKMLLRLKGEQFVFPSGLSGTLDGVRLEVDCRVDGTTRVAAEAQGAWPKGARFQRAGPGTRSLASGDEDFDAAVSIRSGDEVWVRASLTHAARQSLLDFLAPGESMDAASFVFNPGANPRFLSRRIGSFVRCVSFLCFPKADIEGRLGEIVLKDPKVAVRLGCLHLLMVNFIHEPRSLDVCRRLLQHRDERLKLTAAAYLGDEGIPTILASVGNCQEDLLEGVLPIAAHCASRRVGGAALVEILNISDSPWIRLSVLRLIRERGYRECLPGLASGWEKAPEEVRVGILEAFEDLGSAENEGFAFQALQDERPPVTAAAARALEAWGTVEAVPILNRRADYSMQPDVKHACRRAIAKIQSRLGNAERGTLSLAETAGPEGAVSLAPQGGEVSEAPPPVGDRRRETDRSA